MGIFIDRCMLTIVNMFCKKRAPFPPPPSPSSPIATTLSATHPNYMTFLAVPPLAVMLVAGVGMDCLINTLWFLCGVIPGHIHGFYVTWTYFSRRRKVSKGRWPGGPKAFIYSQRVISGDASDERVRQLWKAEQRARDEEQLGRRRSSAARRGRRRSPVSAGGGSRLSAQRNGVGSRRVSPSPQYTSRRESRRESRRQSAMMKGRDSDW